MHYLTRQRLHLSRFHPLMKLLLTLYIASVGAGLWVAALKYGDRAEWSPQGAGTYLLGSEGAGEDVFGDPLGGTPDGFAQQPPMSRRQLVDIAHPHLFTIPIVIFILGHLLHLTRLPDLLKGLVNVVAFVSFLATFLAPFVIEDRLLLGAVMYASGCALFVSFVLLCAIPLWEMWFGRPGRGFDALPRSGP